MFSLLGLQLGRSTSGNAFFGNQTTGTGGLQLGGASSLQLGGNASGLGLDLGGGLKLGMNQAGGGGGLGGLGGTSSLGGLSSGGGLGLQSSSVGLGNSGVGARMAVVPQQELLKLQLQALKNSPFGDSPLFRNAVEVPKAT